jgi:hypothetical protein
MARYVVAYIKYDFTWHDFYILNSACLDAYSVEQYRKKTQMS